MSARRQCLLDAYQITECPNCRKALTSEGPGGAQQILCSLHNEGGLQENLDILPMLTEESYLKAYPEERKARAFLEFCHAGDAQAVAEMIKFSKEASDDEDEHGPSMEHVYRYQDPIGNMQSGLHAAVQAGSREVAWLLLLMASDMPLTEFPALVFQEAGSIGIMREDAESARLPDIRTLRDADGHTAEDLAREMLGQGNAIWNGWIGNGRLAR